MFYFLFSLSILEIVFMKAKNAVTRCNLFILFRYVKKNELQLEGLINLSCLRLVKQVMFKYTEHEFTL
jgi:hypothetical protein